jgi:hypothetical protein
MLINSIARVIAQNATQSIGRFCDTLFLHCSAVQASTPHPLQP